MNPSAPKVQCPFCLAHPRIKPDETMRAHDWGRPGLRKRCPGSGRTKAAANEERLAAKTEGRPATVLSGQPDKVDRPAEVNPEEIF